MKIECFETSETLNKETRYTKIEKRKDQENTKI